MTPLPAAEGQAKILEVITELTAKLDRPPTLQEVGDVIGVTRERVRQQANVLRDQGLLAQSRNLVLPGGETKEQARTRRILEFIASNTFPGKPPPRLSDLQGLPGSEQLNLQQAIHELKEQGVLHNSHWLVPVNKPEYTYEDFFWSHVGVGDPDECWDWIGCEHAEGYGHLNWIGWAGYETEGYAHRIAYSLGKGPLIPGQWVYAKCANKGCCNPKHLVQCLPSEWTSHKADPSWWDTRPVLSKEDAKVIKDLASKGKSIQSIHLNFKDQCTYQTVLSIARGKTYKYA